MRIHFGSLASNNGFQIKMRLYKISLLGGAYRKKCMMWRLGGGVVMAVEKCRMWRWGLGWCRPWRGVFLFFCIAPKGATTKAVVAANR